jgi:hypothetical protein
MSRHNNKKISKEARRMFWLACASGSLMDFDKACSYNEATGSISAIYQGKPCHVDVRCKTPYTLRPNQVGPSSEEWLVTGWARGTHQDRETDPKHPVPLFVAFVDVQSCVVYGNWLSVLRAHKTVGNVQFPIQYLNVNGAEMEMFDYYTCEQLARLDISMVRQLRDLSIRNKADKHQGDLFIQD